MKKRATTILTFFFSFFCSMLDAQQEVEMADTMRSNGKIYVVVAMILLVLVGLLTYLFLIDRRVSRLEDGQKSKKP